ncbi:MAG: response regulator [Bdellovibrionota bacterium]
MANPDQMPQKVLLVDDDPGDLKTLENILKSQNINAVTANDWSTALYQFNQQKFDLAIIELDLDDLLGTALIQKWRDHDVVSKRDCAYIVSIGMQRTSGDEALISEIGDIAKLAKPFKTPAVLGAMAKAMAMAKQRSQLSQIKSQLIDPLLRQKKFDKASEIASKKLLSIGNKGKHLAVKVYEEAGALDKALQVASELAKAEPQNMAYLNEVGRLNMLLGNLDAAKKAFEVADKAAPMNIARLNDMASLYLELKEPENSVNTFRQILNLTPEDKEIKFDMYQRLMQAGFDKHAQDFCKETSTPIELIRHFNNKGVIYSKDNDYISAIDEYKKALDLIPQAKEIYRIKYNMAIAHINLKYVDHIMTAHELLQECLELNPEFEKAREKLKVTEKYLQKYRSAG